MENFGPKVSHLSDKFSAMASNIKHLRPKLGVEKSLSEDDKEECPFSMNHPANSSRQVKSGWLRKQGGMVKSWHRRWFVLNGDCLFYFAKEDDLRPLGTIYLPGNKIIQHPANPEEPDKFLMEVVPGKVPQRMAPNHETFLLCAGSDDERQDWIKSIRKVMFSSIGGAIFGSRLEETMEFEKGRSKRKVPYVVESCIEYLTEYGLDIEGIFRLPGRMLLVRDLKDRFDEGEKVNLDPTDIDVHSVASLLKQFLRELPECLIPYKFYQEFMNIAMRFQDTKTNNNKLEQVKILQAAMANLPKDNYNLMKYLCNFLYKVASKTDINKMSPLNLATVFGPNIIRHPNMDDNPEVFMLTTADISQQLAFMFINYNDQVFTMDYDSGRKSALVPVDDLLNLNDAVDPFENGILKPMGPTPAPRQKVAGAQSDLSDIVFEQRGDRRGRSFQLNADTSTTALSADMESNRNLALNATFQQTHSADSSPTGLHPSFTTDGKPIPPIRRKYTRKDKHHPLSPTNSNESTNSELSGSENSLPYDIHDVADKVTTLTLNNNEPNTTILELQQKLDTMTHSYNSLQMKYDNLYTSKTKSDESVKKLSAELSKVQSRYEEHIKKMEAKHKQQMTEICEKLDFEKTSRANVVEKIVELQKTIHGYQMQYGDIKDKLPPLY